MSVSLQGLLLVSLDTVILYFNHVGFEMAI